MSTRFSLSKRRLLASAATMLTVTAGVVAATAAPAAAATTIATVSDHSAARTELAYTVIPSGIAIKLTTCDTKGDGHHSEGLVVWYSPDTGDDGQTRVKDYGGVSTCASTTVNIAGCVLRYYITAEVWEGSTPLTKTESAVRVLDTC